MKVYILSRGEKGEGGNVRGVYSTIKKAREAVKKEKPCFDGGWVQSEGADLFWTNRCDFLEITVWRIE
jgi:hypothetical protein